MVDQLEKRERRRAENREARPLGMLVMIVLLVVVGLLVFAHGCGQHDHDDELLLPPEKRCQEPFDIGMSKGS
jgi:hypothetical protein